VLTVLLVVPLGLLARHWTQAHLRSLQAIAESDPQAAAHAAGGMLRAFGWLAAGLCALTAGLLASACQLGLRRGCLPPAGWWSLGAHRAATGRTAQRAGRLGLALSTVLVLLGLALALSAEHLVGALAPDR
jgi:hypothetical protein